jgi:DNA-binding LytR/AlgR family response regulator
MEALAIHIGGRQTINPHEVLSLKGEINYTTVNFQEGKKKVIVATTLRKIQDRLEAFPNFFRVTKSTIINMNCIEKASENQILMSNGEILLPSRRRAKDFMGQMAEYRKVN